MVKALLTAQNFPGRTAELFEATVCQALAWAAGRKHDSLADLDDHERTLAAFGYVLAHWKREASLGREKAWPKPKKPRVYKPLGITIWTTEQFAAPSPAVRQEVLKTGPLRAALMYAAEVLGVSLSVVERRLSRGLPKSDRARLRRRDAASRSPRKA